MIIDKDIYSISSNCIVRYLLVCVEQDKSTNYRATFILKFHLRRVSPVSVYLLTSSRVRQTLCVEIRWFKRVKSTQISRKNLCIISILLTRAKYHKLQLKVNVFEVILIFCWFYLTWMSAGNSCLSRKSIKENERISMWNL